MKEKHTVPIYDYNGKTVFGHTGCTYGCLSQEETAITEVAGKFPFLGVPTSDLIPKGRTEPIELDWCQHEY